jgi:hypothetical protein
VWLENRSGESYRARYYDPAVGRFLSEDPIGFAGGGPNFYAYALNNPIRFRDPSGKSAGAATLVLGGGTTICFASGVCEVVAVVGGVAVVVAVFYAASHSSILNPPIEADWRKRPQFQCGQKQKTNHDPACYAVYLEDTALCGQFFTDEHDYEFCMEIAWLNLYRCNSGLPRTNPWAPTQPPYKSPR